MSHQEKRKHHETSESEEEIFQSSKKVGIKMKRKQCYMKAYTEKWSCLTVSSQGPSYVYCIVCKTSFSCAHGGRNDCQKHIDSMMHQKLAKCLKGTPSIANALFTQASKSSEDLTQRVTKAETLLCQLVADGNLSMSLVESLVPLMKRMFPDSKIAQGMQLGRTKATVMLKEMSTLAMNELAGEMKAYPFSIATDGSNEGLKKQFPLVTRSFSKNEDGSLEPVTTRLLALRDCEGSATGNKIFELVDTELQAQGVSWDNCIAFGSDNAPVMTGQHKGVFSFVTDKNSSVYLAACTLHLVHIGAKKGAACLPPVEETLVDIYYFFQKSTLRQSNLRELQELYDVEQRRMLKHGCTRWLSIARCIKRLLESWEPLKHLFHQELKAKKAAEEKKKNREKKTAETGSKDENTMPVDNEHVIGVSTKRLETISDFLRSPTNKLSTVFLSYTLKVYDGVLVKLQADEPLIQELHASLNKLLQNLFSRFMTPASVHGKELTEVPFQERAKQKEDKDLLIGDEAREMLRHPEEHHLRQERIQEFYSNVRSYFETICAYLLKKLPLRDPLLQHARMVDPAMQLTATQEDLDYFLKRFPPLLPAGASVDTIVEQFATYQMTNISDCLADTVDKTWVAISKAHPDLKPLCEVMLGICTIPHSSAACERVFSCVRKTCTDQRASLGQDTVEALMVLKARPDKPYTVQELQQLKSAYCKHQKQYKH